MTQPRIRRSNPRLASVAHVVRGAALRAPVILLFVMFSTVIPGPHGLAVVQRCLAAEIVVNSLIEGVPRNLHDAIIEANTLPGGPHTIVFDVTGAYQPMDPLPPLLWSGTQIRGELNSAGDPCSTSTPRFTLQGNLLPITASGIIVDANDCLITGLAAVGCPVFGIVIRPARTGNRIGTPGPELCERVFVLMNGGTGVLVAGAGTDDNIIQNCRIFGNGGNGVEISGGSTYNIVGFDVPGQRNYIYANSMNGILLANGGEQSSGPIWRNTIAGNFIYTNGQNGIYSIGSQGSISENLISNNGIGISESDIASGNGIDGIRLTGGSPLNTIRENLILDNEHNGVSLFDDSNETTVSGNLVGVTADGAAIGNHGFGIYLQTDANQVGPGNTVMYNGDGGSDFAGVALIDGATAAPAQNTISENVISSNIGRGLVLSGNGTIDNWVWRNYIGTDALSRLLGNSEAGVRLAGGANANVIQENVIGANGNFGVRLQDGADANKLYGNHIGTDASDQLDLGNAGGIRLASSGNLIGDAVAGHGNTISFNDGWGIWATADAPVGDNYIAGNYIGTNSDGDLMGNTEGGIWLGDGLIDNSVGDWPETAGAGNTIMYNQGPGVKVGELNAVNVPVRNLVLTNRICENTGDPIVLTQGGNDMLPPPTVTSGFNAVQWPSGELVGMVSGWIGYTHPPDVPTKIQVFYDTAESCGNFYDQVHVPDTEETWTLQGAPLASNVRVYATESSRGPSVPQPTPQTSPVSENTTMWGWWQRWNDWCQTLPCPWLGHEDAGRSASWVDYDADGLQDLFICNAASGNILVHNLGGETFATVAIGDLAAPLAVTSSAAWGDVDDDGDLDVYVVNHLSENRLFLNDGVGGFVDMTPEGLDQNGPGRCAAWADYDLDGDLDFFLTNFGTADLLFRNNGDLTFTYGVPIVEPAWDVCQSVGAAWGDYDSDGDPDLFVVNGNGPSWLLRNDREAGFTNATSGPLGDPGPGRGVVWGDFQNDGLLDLYIVNHCSPNRLLRNMGSGTFVDVTSGPEGDAGCGRGVSAGDLDLDGDLDLLVANDPEPGLVLLNDGEGHFAALEDSTPRPDGSHYACPQADYNLDGDPDVFLVEGTSGADNTLLLNVQAEGNHWLHVNLAGSVSNSFGVGARIEVTTFDGMRRSVQTRYVSAGTGSLGQDSMTEEFGLGAAASATSIRVTWPSGIVNERFDVPGDGVLVIEELSGEDAPPEPDETTLPTELLSCVPNPVRLDARVRFRLAEPGPVRLAVYDAAGRAVRTLADGTYGAGLHEVGWDGRDEQQALAAAGVYFLRLDAAGRQHRGTVALIR